MKKKYLSPKADLQLMATEEMIATSVDGFNSALDNDNTITVDQMLSRRRNVWDDEVEDEY